LQSKTQYDYIIAGAGCAGLSLIMHMIHSGKFADKKILLVDKDKKDKNDRTWCFWEKEVSLFEPIVKSRWHQAWFHGEEFSALLSLKPYEYKLIRGIDFYKYCFEKISACPNIQIRFGNVTEVINRGDHAAVIMDGARITAQYIFSSILFSKPELNKKEIYLLQHFKGWIIELNEPRFKPDEATLMDFRVDQSMGATFVYIMPFSETKVLIEYTLFSDSLLTPARYDEGLGIYIKEVLGISNYKKVEEEFGIIPMTNYKFPTHDGHVIFIGTAGGQTKASSGYTFRFIQKHSTGIVQQMILNKKPVAETSSKKFNFYDSVLLQILHEKKMPAEIIFNSLFRKNKPQSILRFLDNESSLKEDIKIISSLPTTPFLKAALKQALS
jgi:lycopene beta-cyclase